MKISASTASHLDEMLPLAEQTPPQSFPFIAIRAPGFSVACDDYVEKGIDLNEAADQPAKLLFPRVGPFHGGPALTMVRAYRGPRH